MFDVLMTEHPNHPYAADGPIGQVAGRPVRHGRFRIVLGAGFARDTVVVRYGTVEVARRCGVTTRPDSAGGGAGVLITEVPVGAIDHHLEVEVVGRLISGSVELPAPADGEVTVEVDLDRDGLHLALA
ncbi:MAG: hypothetical protein KDB24_07625 [Microthrixaceae bacterium]|nr:hypothetical protein [Microthrixaceae bacterium]